MQRLSVLFSHGVQLVAPWGLLFPQPIASIAGGVIILQQLLLVVSGNYSWLNWLTIILGLSAFSDATLGAAPIHGSAALPIPLAWLAVLIALAVFTVIASIAPVRNLFSRQQAMNRSYNPLHLVNTYGAFGAVTQTRYEIVLEATQDVILNERTTWHEYAFRAKPGDPRRRPPQVAPYHLRLDWMMWFLPFSVVVGSGGLSLPGYELWFLRLLKRLLAADPATLRLLRRAPLGLRRPAHVRALYYRYQFSSPTDQRLTGAWWTRDLIGVYLPPVTLSTLERFEI